jgi:hypothetical protein
MSENIVEITSSLSKKQKKQKNKCILLEIIEDIKESLNVSIDNEYTMIRKKFGSCEYIPSNIIPVLIKYYFKSSELLISYNENHGIYKIKIKDLLVDMITNWEYNRPPDMERCPDIARYIYNSKKTIDTMIHLSFNNVTEIFEVLDGIHRITALKMIKDENSKLIEPLLYPGDFGSENELRWLYEQYLVVNIRFNATLGELIEVFKNLNKSQTVSELYICDHSRNQKDVIETIVNEWYFKYKKHFSSSANPMTGNTNRTKFSNLLLHLYDKHKIRHSNPEKLKKMLEEANTKISTNIPSKVTFDTRVKCKETGCYLFLLKNDVLEEFI